MSTENNNQPIDIKDANSCGSDSCLELAVDEALRRYHSIRTTFNEHNQNEYHSEGLKEFYLCRKWWFWSIYIWFNLALFCIVGYNFISILILAWKSILSNADVTLLKQSITELSKYIIGILLGLAYLAAKFYFSHPVKDKSSSAYAEDKASTSCFGGLLPKGNK